MPTTVESIGDSFRDAAKRAEEPLVTMTVAPMPAPTVSTAISGRPVGPPSTSRGWTSRS